MKRPPSYHLSKREHPRIRSPYTPQVIAEWMFDHGKGYANEPHFMLFNTLFYASDFLPEKREFLAQKTQEAEYFYQLNNKQQQFGDALILPLVADDNGHYSQDKTNKHLLNCQRHAEAVPDRSDEEAAFMAAHDMLEMIKNGENPLFSDRAITDAQSSLPRKKRGFVRAMQHIAPELLEYAARKELSFYVSIGYDHPALLSDESMRGRNLFLTSEDEAQPPPYIHSTNLRRRLTRPISAANRLHAGP